MANGKVVLVTGASSGIGKAAAARLAGQGYEVFGISRKPAEAEHADGYKMVQLDVTHDDCAKNCIAEVTDAAGRIDVLVNNAGYAQMGPLENVSVEQLKEQFETNLYGVHRMTQAALPGMFAQGGGRIVNISSGIGRVSLPFMAAYCSSKFALEGYSEGLSKELAPHGIDVVIVEPGLTVSEFHENTSAAADVGERYQPALEAMQAGWPEMLKHADSVDTVAAVIQRAMEDDKPELRYVCPAAEGIVAQVK